MTRHALIAVTVILVGLTMAPSASALPADITRLAIIGDSITVGYGVPAGQGYADQLEASTPGDNVLPLAHNGATVRRWLPGGPYYSDMDRLTGWAPVTVLVELGTNDYYIARSLADYAADLGMLVAQIRSRVPAARVILWHHYGGHFTQDPAVCDIQPCAPRIPPPSWHDYGQAMRLAAIDTGSGHIDDSVARTWSAWLLPDRAHLTSAGHAQLHQSIRDRLVVCC